METPYGISLYNRAEASESAQSFTNNSRVEEPYNGIDQSTTASLIESHFREPTESAKPAPQRKGCLDLRWWLPEIVASVLSLVSFVSLVFLLWSYQGRSLEDLHLPASLTLNGVVAIISTINRAALMIPVGSIMSQEVWLWLSKRRGRLADLDLSDAASRGAWGSMQFLIRPRKRWLGSSGAIVTVLALAFTTFTQQLLAFRSFPVNEDDLKPANIPRSESWRNFSGNPAEGENSVSIPLTMKAAIYNGMLSESIEPITASCPTGNCTWPLTPTMAVCGGCSKSTYMTNCDSNLCNYTMPSGNVASLTNFWSDNGLGEGPGFTAMQGPGAVYRANDSSRIYMSNFDVFGAPYTAFAPSASDPNSWPNKSTVSSECALWMCVQAINVTSLRSQQIQASVEEFSSVVNSGLEAYDVFVNYTFLPLPASMMPRAGADYNVSAMAMIFLKGYLASMINGTGYLYYESQSTTSDSIQAIWSASADLDAWIKNLALSMTNVVRTNIPESSEMYDGTGFQLGVQIHWAWIVLPAFLVLMSLFILVCAIVQTTRSPVSAWKGSPLALLFMDVDANIKKRAIVHMDNFDGLQNAASRRKVVLETGSTGGRILKEC